MYVTEDGINCTFLRDVNKLDHKTENSDNLGSLLKQFFEFYSHFDFSAKAVCLNEAVAITKPEHSPLYIVNPLERGLNVSKNVSLEEVQRFKSELQNAAWTMESQEIKATNWGILSLFEKARVAGANTVFPMHLKHGRLMEVRKLFEEEEEEGEELNDITYKNEEIKKQVQEIKRETRATLKNIAKHEAGFQQTAEKYRR